uniref:Nucleotide-binding alpha-beta plait domain-containing protein n=1 Tax=Tanacetum cinerariifolium TaxID=118510 RepID=A0A699GM42_TANCI|nr:nucleotide-binding alpha-beta plait domain-containing protein [Tanacetum cinerariifolium]
MDLLLTGDDDEDDDASRVNTSSPTTYLNSLSPLNYQKYDNLDSNVLWRMFEKYGNLVDVYISFKRTKRDTRFGFVRFINTCDIEAFERRLKGTMTGDVRIIDRAKFIKGENKGSTECLEYNAKQRSWGMKRQVHRRNDDDFEEEFIGPSMEDLSDGDFFDVRNMNGLEDDELALIHSPKASPRVPYADNLENVICINGEYVVDYVPFPHGIYTYNDVGQVESNIWSPSPKKH